MNNKIEIWAQDSKVKGLRIIRFRVDEKPDCVRWLGPIGEPDDREQFRYGRKELIDCGWELIE